MFHYRNETNASWINPSLWPAEGYTELTLTPETGCPYGVSNPELCKCNGESFCTLFQERLNCTATSPQKQWAITSIVTRILLMAFAAGYEWMQ